jgi:tetratricopeptide (TPR) repeat protein
VAEGEGGRLLAFTALRGDAPSPATRALWQRLERLPYPQQMEAIEVDEGFHSAALCRFLETRSLVASADHPQVGSELANLAVRIAWHLEPGVDDPPGAEWDLRAVAYGYLGAARRALGELEAAGDALDMARTLRARGTGAPGVEAEILWFEVWVRLVQHRFARAIHLLDRMMAADAASSAAEPGSLRPAAPVAALVAKAWCSYHRGDIQSAQRLLEEAQRYDLRTLPALDLASRFGLLWCAITAGRFAEAENRLAAAASLVAQGRAENAAARWLLRRAQARIDVAKGNFGPARQALREAATALAREGQGTEAALAWLALARLYLEERRSKVGARVERIAVKLATAFIPDAEKGQLLAVSLFINACLQGELTVASVIELARAIEDYREPGLVWWAEWRTVLTEAGGRDAAPLAAG